MSNTAQMVEAWTPAQWVANHLGFLVLVSCAALLPAQSSSQPPTADRHVAQWAELLQQGEVDSRREAAIDTRGLDSELQQQLLPIFIELLQHEKDGQIRLAILDTVGDMGQPAAAAVDALLVAMQRDFGGRRNEELHQDHRAALALSHIGPAAVPGLRKLLGEDADSLRIEAALALGRIGPPAAAATAELIAMLDAKNSQVRASASHALGSLGVETLDQLQVACRSEQSVVRASAVAAVGRIGVSAADNVASVETCQQVVTTALQDSQPNVRAAAVRAAVELSTNTEQQRTILLEALSDEQEEVRVAAVNALASRPKLLREMEPDLAQLLSANDAGVAWHAAFVLHLLGIEGVPTLKQAINNDQCPVDLIAQALALIGRPLIGPLSEWLKDPSPRVRQAAALALGQIRPLADETILLLADGLKDEDRVVRAAVVQALQRLGARARPTIAAIRLLPPDQDVVVRLQVIEILLAAAPRDQLLIDELIACVGDPDPRVQRQAIDSLRATGPFGRPAIAAVIQKLHSSDAMTRVAAAKFVADHGPYAAQAVPLLSQSLNAADAKWRITAIDTVGELGKAAQSALPNLSECLRDPNPEVRAATVRALANLQFAPQDIQPQISAALHDADETVRTAALSSLRRFGQRGAIFLPDVILLTVNEKNRDSIVRVLERFERSATDATALPRLVELLEHEQPEVRRWSIKFLGLAGAEAASVLPLLQTLQQNEEESIRAAASEAIEKIGSTEDTSAVSKR